MFGRGTEHWRDVGPSSDLIDGTLSPLVYPWNDTALPGSLVNFVVPRLFDQLGPNTWEAARWAANSAVSAAQAILEGAPAAYALCRPPGHHAYADLAGGFCFLNNSAIAAQVLCGAHPRVAILDVPFVV